MTQRILWLLNHGTLRASEVAMLHVLGYEVFTPKCYPQDEQNLSCSVSYADDATLTIPEAALQRLNAWDFYAGGAWPADLAEIINAYFDVAIVACYSGMLNAVCASFVGPIFMHAFGREGAYTYMQLLRPCQQHVIDRIRQQRNIWLAPAYGNIAEMEPAWLHAVCVELPIGLAASYYAGQPSWRGGRPDILCVIPRIKTSAYFIDHYHVFKARFGDMPHIIAGGQFVPVTDDPHVTGMLDGAQYHDMMQTCAAMLYDYSEPRHVHLHPMEAIIVGLPVVYLDGGLLALLAGSDLPGCCKSLDEARELLERLSIGDAALAAEIASAQAPIADLFRPERILAIWQERFLPLVT
jgi:hypothetical protein